MRVAHDLGSKLLVTIERAPRLGPGQEVALIAAQAIEYGGLLAFERAMVGGVCDTQAAEIADVLAQSEAAVDLQAGQYRVLRILVGEAVD